MVCDPKAPIKIVVSDMDGTLLGPDKELSLATKQAAHTLQKANIPLALVSARPPRAMLPYIEQLSLETSCAGFNGGLIFTPKGRICRNEVFPVSIVEELLRALSAFTTDVWFQNDTKWFVRDPLNDLVQREQGMLGIKPDSVADLWTARENVNRIIVTGPDEDMVARLEERLGVEFSHQASVLRSTPIKLNITPARATKGYAVKELAALYGLTPQNVACLGDAPNDLPMLREAGIGIAMGQAPAHVKEDATYVTGSNAKDGWAEAIETFIMPRVLHN